MRNCNSHKTITQAGNVLIYVLIGILLIGALTLTLSRQADQSDALDLSDEQAELYALEIIEYTQAAQNVITQMEITGTSFSEFDFINPSSSAFNTAPHIHKVFHPQGGGLTYKEMPEYILWDAAAPGSSSIHAINHTNFEWTPSTATDAVLIFFGIKEEICAKINESITGSSTIPVLVGALSSFFESTSVNDFNIANCAACEGYPQLCVENGANTAWGFYSILIPR